MANADNTLIVDGLNSLDLMRGALPELKVGLWTPSTDGTPVTPSMVSLGLLQGTSFDLSRTYKKVNADNTTWTIDSFLTQSDAGIKASLVQAALNNIALLMGDDWNDGVGGGDMEASSAGAIYPLDEPTDQRYYQVQLVAHGQSMRPGYGGQETAVYTTRTFYFWRCKLEAKLTQPIKRDGEVINPFEAVALLDTSMIYAPGAYGRVGVIIDTPGVQSQV